jgi:hypothetical protein
MRDKNRLRPLQVRVRRHRSVAGLLCLIHKLAGQLNQQLRNRIDLRADVEPQVRRDLLVATAAGVQLEAHFSGQFHQPLFDVVVHVLNRRIVGRGNPLSRDLIEGLERERKLSAVEHSCLGERGGMRLAGRHLVGHKNAIERKRALPLFEAGIRLLAEAARPHLHFRASACSSARERAGSPRMRMKPSASF